MKHGVVANQIRESQRTDGVVHAQLHDAINGFGFCHAFLKRENGFVNHGTKDAVGNKAGCIVARESGLAHLLGSLHHGGVGRFAGVCSVDDFNEFHDGNRVHEMHTDDLVGSLGGGGDGRDGNRRGV